MPRAELCPYTCTKCEKPQRGAPTAVLALLNLCAGCQQERYATGLAKQQSAAAEAARG